MQHGLPFTAKHLRPHHRLEELIIKTESTQYIKHFANAKNANGANTE